MRKKVGKTKSKSKINAGTKAQKNGSAFEDVIKNICTLYKFESVKEKNYLKNQSMYDKYDRLLILQPKKGSIIRVKPSRSDFLLKVKNANPTSQFTLDSSGNLEVVVECKTQQTSGSTDEKMVRLWVDMDEQMISQKNVMLLTHGDKFNQRAITFMKNKSHTLKNRGTYNFEVMDFTKDFMPWLKQI